MSVDVPAFGEPICIVRLRVPRCGLTFGISPCTATGEPCYQTSATCKDIANFSQSEQYLYFGMPNQTRPTDEIYVLPFLASWPATTAARVNVAGSDRRISPLGVRAKATINFIDRPHSDNIVDPYRAGRSYDPMHQGTFWSKFAQRNRYQRHKIEVAIFEGFAGDALADMTRRIYLFESLDLTGEGAARVGCVDPLSLASGDRAKIPPISPGALASNLTATATSFHVTGATLDDYPASGTLRINDEVMTYTGVADDGDAGLLFSGLVRGTDNSEAGSHEQDDLVQECVRFADEEVDRALERVWSYTPIDPAYLPVTDWRDTIEASIPSYRLTGLLTVPEKVQDVLGEIYETAQVFQWWDEVASKINLGAVLPLLSGEPKVITEDQIEAGSFDLVDEPSRRVSMLTVYYAQRDPTESVKQASNYSRAQLSIDLDSESDTRFGERAEREIYARLLRSRPVAFQIASRILSRYSEGSREISFTLDDRHADLQVGETFYCQHRRIQKTDGTPDLAALWVVTSRKLRPMDRRVDYVAEDSSLAGRLYTISPAGTPDYAGDGSDSLSYAWISLPDGTMPISGKPGATIA